MEAHTDRIRSRITQGMQRSRMSRSEYLKAEIVQLLSDLFPGLTVNSDTVPKEYLSQLGSILETSNTIDPKVRGYI